jgi:acyl-CoA synthetase (AMP-forming)/AMP-acid ligase II
MNIGELIRRNARLTPDKTAMVFGQTRTTYRVFDERSNALLNGLHGLGIRHADRVATLGDNSDRYLEVFGAVAKGGLVLVPLNPRLTAAEIAFMLRDSGRRRCLLDVPIWSSRIRSARSAQSCGTSSSWMSTHPNSPSSAWWRAARYATRKWRLLRRI